VAAPGPVQPMFNLPRRGSLAPRGTREAADPGCPASTTTQRMRGTGRRKGSRVTGKGSLERMHERDRRAWEPVGCPYLCGTRPG